jgi:replicative DNA helicase
MSPLPPSNVPAEQALLGALMANNTAYDLVSDFLSPEHFADRIHGRIFEAIQRNIEAGRVTDPILLKTQFENAGVLDEVGGTEYLALLISAMITPRMAGDYGRAVYDTWQRRELIILASDITEASNSPNDDLETPDDIIGEAERRFVRIGGSSNAGADGVMLAKSVGAAIEEGDLARSGAGRNAVSCGFPSIDQKIMRLRPGNLIVGAARPGMGKTSLAKGIALSVALGRTHYPRGETADDPNNARLVLYFSFEASPEDFGAVCVSELASVEVTKVLDGTDDLKAAERIVAAQKLVENAPLKSYHRATSLAALRRTVRREARRSKHPIGLVVVDYLQLMPDHPGMDKRLSVGANVRGLKNLAMELSIPILTLSQLSRRVEDRADKRPQMSDLRETGEIEDAADVVYFLYRQHYYDSLTRPPYDPSLTPQANGVALAAWQSDLDRIKYDAELIVGKCRRGEAPTLARPIFNGAFSRFEEPFDGG